ncbi:MAG: multiple antibiotic resistance protein [Thermoplasmata archaeon]|nr:multiple antibiotic resistance protein [Thermoplasmata archaeon]
MDWAALLAILVSVFAIVNPVGVIPTFLALTGGYDAAMRRRVITKAVLVGAGVLVVFGLAGQFIFSVFSITIPAFRIAGGILIFKVAFDMLQGERPKADSNDAEIADALERENIGITPLGVPLLTGPGAITTVMILLASHADRIEQAVVYASVLVTFAVAALLLVMGERLFRFLGRSGLQVFTRIMGLLLAAVAVQFILNGIAQALPGLTLPH